MTGAYFRAGVGSVIYRQNGDIAIWKRATPPIGIWQLQQGGIDAGETLEVALWRELQEETGLTQNDFTTIHQYPHWTWYEYSEAMRLDGNNQSPNRLGQCHRWWFLQLNDLVEIDLTKATDDEFDGYRFTSFAELIAETHSLKRPVYDELQKYFEAVIQQKTPIENKS